MTATVAIDGHALQYVPPTARQPGRSAWVCARCDLVVLSDELELVSGYRRTLAEILASRMWECGPCEPMGPLAVREPE